MPLKCLRRWKLGNLCPKCVLVVKSSFEDMKNSSSVYKIKKVGWRPILDKNLYYWDLSRFCSLPKAPKIIKNDCNFEYLKMTIFLKFQGQFGLYFLFGLIHYPWIVSSWALELYGHIFHLSSIPLLVFHLRRFTAYIKRKLPA